MRCKKFLLLMCFVIFLFVGCSDVYALNCKIGDDKCTEEYITNMLNEDGKELACLYEMTYSNGKKYYWYLYYKRAITENAQYSKTNRDIFGVAASFTFATVIDDIYVNNESYDGYELKSCPEKVYVADYFDRNASAQRFRFNICLADDLECSDENSTDKFKDSKFVLVKDKMDSIIFKRTDRITEYVDNENYCIYSVSSGDYSWIVYSKEKNAIFFNEYTSKLKVSVGLDSSKSISDKTYNLSINHNGNSCPNQIYYANEGTKYYFSDQEIDDVKDKNKKTYVLWEPSKEPAPDPNPSDCTLFDDDLREIINGVMDIIKIAVPLLLICFIGLDFGKAIFASDEKAISKAKKNAIIRIIVAIVIYFVPTLLNLLFNIANDVWADVHYEVCVLNENDTIYENDNN